MPPDAIYLVELWRARKTMVQAVSWVSPARSAHSQFCLAFLHVFFLFVCFCFTMFFFVETVKKREKKLYHVVFRRDPGRSSSARASPGQFNEQVRRCVNLSAARSGAKRRSPLLPTFVASVSFISFCRSLCEIKISTTFPPRFCFFLYMLCKITV